MISVNEALEIVKRSVKEKRYTHTLAVVKEAKLLGEIHHLDTDKLALSAALHDVCKYVDLDEQKNNLYKHFSKEEVDSLPIGAYHAYSGYLKAKELGITDVDILNPIKYHTTGKINMTDYEKIVFISDFSEETRDFSEAKVAHEIAIKSLDKAVVYVFEEVLKMLIDENKNISPSIYENLEYYKGLIK